MVPVVPNADYSENIFGKGCNIFGGGSRCGPQPQRNYQPGPPRPAQPARQVVPTRPPAGNRHAAEVQIKSEVDGRSQHGTGCIVLYKGQQFILTCAHIFEPGWKAYVKINKQWVETTILTSGAIADIAILKAPRQHPNPLTLAATHAAPGTKIVQAGRIGTVLGYEGGNIKVKCFARGGDSGGPITSSQGIVGIVTEYSPTDQGGATIGPNVKLIAELLESLLSTPPVVNKPPVILPVVPDTSLLARISLIEQRMKALPNCDGISINKTAIAIHSKKIESLETDLREARIGLQRVIGVVDTMSGEVITHNKSLGSLSAKNRDTLIRIQRLEQSTTTLPSKLRGKMQFRLRIDQSGRVTGVEPQ